MGLDLTICLVRHTNPYGWLLHTRIDFDRDYDIFGQLGAKRSDCPASVITALPIPQGTRVQWYGDEGIQNRTTDPYGDALTYIKAGDFNNVAVPSNASKWNKGVLAMMRELPPETPVVLWWH